ncbi:hypothetical protein ACIPPS_19230 [Streptomyces sp. NPDC090127]|uniref:hypothetical protein n=1 Tax=Streptomyces sp. NPDC090127 TaxID=3365953 RepID=UPI003809BF4E
MASACWPFTTTSGPGQPRLSRITHHDDGTDAVTPLTWDGAEPVDLEAIEAVPGTPGEYVALAARGLVYRLAVVGTRATVVDYAPLPAIDEGDDFESFALVAQNGKLAALWADRGPRNGPGPPRHPVRGAPHLRRLGAAPVRRRDDPGLPGAVPGRRRHAAHLRPLCDRRGSHRREFGGGRR